MDICYFIKIILETILNSKISINRAYKKISSLIIRPPTTKIISLTLKCPNKILFVNTMS